MDVNFRAHLTYEIRVKGSLGRNGPPGLTALPSRRRLTDETILVGPVPDSGLHGLLADRDRGASTLIRVNRTDRRPIVALELFGHRHNPSGPQPGIFDPAHSAAGCCSSSSPRPQLLGESEPPRAQAAATTVILWLEEERSHRRIPIHLPGHPFADLDGDAAAMTYELTSSSWPTR